MSFSDKLKAFADDAKGKIDEWSPEVKSALSKAEEEARILAKKAEPEVKSAMSWSGEQAKSLAGKAEAEIRNRKGSHDTIDIAAAVENIPEVHLDDDKTG